MITKTRKTQNETIKAMSANKPKNGQTPFSPICLMISTINIIFIKIIPFLLLFLYGTTLEQVKK